MYVYIRISRDYMYTYIAVLVSRARCLPSVSLFHPPAPNLGAVFPVVSFFSSRLFPLPQISLLLSLRTSLASSEHVLFTLLFPFPLPRSTHPVLQLALRSVLLSHFAFKVRLSLPNNIILSLDTSPCEGGRRHDRRLPRSSRRVNPRREVFLFSFFPFLTSPLFRLYSQLNMIFRGTDATGRRINLINLSY